MVRTRGCCRKGRRLIGKAPWGHWKTTTFVAGLRCNEISAPCVLDGAMDGQGGARHNERSDSERPAATASSMNLRASSFRSVVPAGRAPSVLMISA
jgi:hypothetical protein